ncbi:MAG TPA: UvrB/UvrC motif-containing protein [Bacillota bacterium]|nr:UvrB/UvrC motif-containing protein [Bacillota bacterium]
MLCDECKKRPANVHITKIVNGVKSEAHLCEECAGEKGELTLFSESKFSFPSLLTGLLQTGPGIGSHVSIHDNIVDGCENCGLSFSTFANRGFLGCSECYTHFGPRLEPLIRRIHGTYQHTGKVPKRIGGTAGVMREIENLRRDLAKLVSQEKYEEAAVVRDKIKALEKRLSDEA